MALQMSVQYLKNIVKKCSKKLARNIRLQLNTLVSSCDADYSRSPV